MYRVPLATERSDEGRLAGFDRFFDEVDGGH